MVECVEMTNEGLRELAIMLSLNKELRYLALNGNQIDDNGLKLLSDALRCNRSLEYLYLNNCDLKDECVPLIIEMMKHSKTLMSIELVKNRLTEHGKTVLTKASNPNKTCSIYLDFTFH
jgi:Ran GTPase-activating protein (RanGAP) involved in mRNA processing and transport